jgi:hypothetical protein
MTSEAVKLAKIERDKDIAREIFKLFQNPAFSLTLAVLFIEIAQKYKLMGENVGTLLEAALAGSTIGGELAKSGALERASEALGNLLKAVGAIAPVVAAG